MTLRDYIQTELGMHPAEYQLDRIREIVNSEWRPMDTAPKDENILLDVNRALPVVGAWNEKHQDYVFSRRDTCNDEPYFITDHEKIPLAWREITASR